MSKRKITHQQSARINKKQEQLQQQSNELGLHEGLVLSRFGKQAEIETPEGQKLICNIRPAIDSLVAGDRVTWQAEGNQQGVVLSRHPRTTVLARPNLRGLSKAVAANITQMIIVAAPLPEISWPLLDAYLIVADILQLKPVILLNKIDLQSDEIQQRLREEYQSLNYDLLFCTKASHSGIESLKLILADQVSVFVGQSGVGKSSLISQILPEEDIVTQSISELSELGQHTTSNSRYYHLPSGGAIIDSPGVREFGLGHVDKTLLARHYREFIPWLTQCKFRDCNHLDTPHCAILQALESGKISKNRYQNFVKLYQQYFK